MYGKEHYFRSNILCRTSIYFRCLFVIYIYIYMCVCVCVCVRALAPDVNFPSFLKIFDISVFFTLFLLGMYYENKLNIMHLLFMCTAGSKIILMLVQSFLSIIGTVRKTVLSSF
jgi:hypothetical protein